MRHELDYIFRPRSVAVIGASRRKGSIGREILHKLLMSEFNGKVFPVNPNTQVIHSIKSYSTILDVPDAVDLAIIIIPKEYVKEVVRQCGEKGVKGLIIITAGFSELGPEGKQRELEIMKIVREYGMRMIGPNCFGVVNADPEINLNATFGKTSPRMGNVGFISQSGAMGEAIMNHANDLGIGFSIIASIGNKADISSNDILEYLKNAPNTDIILMYLENFGNPRNFTRIAREVSRQKPITAVKSGRTKLGAKAASSHTGALAGLDVGVDALFEQTGVMRVDTIEELFDVAAALSSQPIPKGNRVVVVTNAGGPGILATDALINSGMEMPDLTPSTVKELKKFVADEASFSNPMDMVAGAGPREFKLTLEAIEKDKRFDIIIPIFVPPVMLDELEVAKNIQSALSNTNKAVYACLMGAGQSSAGTEYLKKHKIPVYIFPEAIAKTLASINGYKKWLNKRRGKVINFDVNTSMVKQIIDDTLKGKDGSIVGENALKILDSYGIQTAQYRQAGNVQDAMSIAKEISYPVVMKVSSPKILHKTEVGGVIVDLRSDTEVRDAFNELKQRVEKSNKGKHFSVVLQQMITGAVETVIGMTTDPSFGPLIMFGLGGIYVEIMKDVSFRINPLTNQSAKEMIRSLRSYPLLTGFRGAPPVHLETIEAALLRLSQLVKDFDCFTEIDINPFIVSPDKKYCKAVDARFIVNKSRT
ncbi:MAG: acetate--CoA ligase family protein [Candidatus Aminicenantes bacterium]|nr:acetate--CoA ligase family protein [Candidatus Aminicenantes bacterium]